MRFALIEMKCKNLI